MSKTTNEKGWLDIFGANSGIPELGVIFVLSYSYIVAMSKIIQSAYSSIGAQKYKKAATLLESPEVARYPIAKVWSSFFTFHYSL